MQGDLSDLSLRGCCLLLKEADPALVGAAIEVTLTVKGTALLLAGVVRNVTRGRRTGIEFVELSDRKRQQVQELMAELVEARLWRS